MIKLAETDMARVKKNMIDMEKSDKTIHETLAIVRQIYNHAKRPDIYILAKVKMPRVENAKLRYLVPEEIGKLLNALKEKSDVVHDQALIAVNCGLRFSEVAGLRWEDVNYDTGTMAIRDSKTGSRTVFINEAVKEVLEARHEKQEEYIKKKRDRGIDVKKTPWIFPDNEGNRQDRCSKTFQRVADELFNKDIKDRRLRISFHSLRHTFGTHVYENSGDLYLTQKALGHKTMVMAARYAKMSETKLREAFTRMSDVMQKGREAAKKRAEQQ
ncbi:MAG TPA: site-specific integrase, partial [Syntrophorhabdus sp.]|nr:site-specific integrase [Syntrophorhabdus sp.]